jgi:hypothetical protein
MNISIAISLGALVVSVASIAITVHFNLKESAKVKAFSIIFLGSAEDVPTIRVVAINVGRRPTIIRALVGMDDHKNWAGVNLGEDHQGIRLGENERFEKLLKNSDLGFFWDEETIEFTELYFEDSVGRRHRITNSRTHIREFWNAHKKYREARDKEREMHALVTSHVQAALRDSVDTADIPTIKR